MKRCTPRQMALVDILLTTENISYKEAGERAGFSQKNAEQTASRALKLPHVKAYYEQQLAARSKRVGVDADYVLKRLSDIDRMDVGDIIDEHGKLKPIHKWPAIWRQMVHSFDIKAGKIRLPDKLRNLELIGKHIGVRAFAEQVEITDTTGIAERMEKARKRAGKDSK